MGGGISEVAFTEQVAHVHRAPDNNALIGLSVNLNRKKF